MESQELKILQGLDVIIRRANVQAAIEPIVRRAEGSLEKDTEALLTWEPVPLATYGEGLSKDIRSSWVFAIRARAETGAERHPNSRQRMVSYRSSGDLQTKSAKDWLSHRLVSDLNTPLEQRWVSIAPNTWHQAVTGGENWIVISFHTATEHELIEERSDTTDPESYCQRRYTNG